MGGIDSGLAQGQGAPAIPAGHLDAPSSWLGKDLSPGDWRIEVGPAAKAELESLARRLQGSETPIEELRLSDFECPAVERLMAAVRDRVSNGIGFAVIDRLPIEGLDERTAKGLAWLLVSHAGTIVNQKFRGQRVYEVRDTGTEMQHGVRRSITNLEQELHTDGGWLAAPPQFVGLACIRQAETGGISRVGSLIAAHNEMQKRHPELLKALYQPMWWDRQAEHAAEDAPCSRYPIFAWDGAALMVRYYDDYVRQGHKMQSEPLNSEAEDALRALRAIVDAPGYSIELRLEPGQVEIVNNHLIGHARSAFQDSRPEAGRLLLRLWLREGSGIEMEPTTAPPA